MLVFDVGCMGVLEGRKSCQNSELCQVFQSYVKFFFGTILAGSDFQAMRIELCQVFLKVP